MSSPGSGAVVDLRHLRWLTMVAGVLLAGLAHAIGTVNLPDFSRLVEKQGAAVVNISASQPSENAAVPFPGLDEKDPMFEFFRRFVPRHPRMPELDPDNRSLGSGFIVSDDGYILTNAHVVDEAEEIVVRLADKREFVATVVGADPRSDVALIKIEASGLPKITLGDPARLKVGEWVVAIGSPFGFDQTVTAGIVSAKGRSLPDENFVPFIQTDVAINPGNSGGPLFNLKGEVVGINSQIYSQTGGFMGLSFAIPIDVAMDVQRQLRASGRVQRGRIGVAIQEVSSDLADSFGLPRAAGALISAVEPDGPAARAGVQQGDVILRFDGKAVEASTDLPRIVAASRPGARVSMQLYRGGVPREVSVEVGEWRDAQRDRKAARAKTDAANRLGLVLLQPSTVQKRDAASAQGLIVEHVQGAAARADIRPGDVVLGMVSEGRQAAVRSVDEFNHQVAAMRSGQRVTLLVKRGEATSYVSLKVDR